MSRLITRVLCFSYVVLFLINVSIYQFRVRFSRLFLKTVYFIAEQCIITCVFFCKLIQLKRQYFPLSFSQFINATAIFEIKYVSYENPSSKTADGKCCDGLPRCRSNCTNVFVICLRDIKNKICGINGFTSKVFVGDYLTFKNEHETGIRNPHAFFLLTTPVSIIYVNFYT